MSKKIYKQLSQLAPTSTNAETILTNTETSLLKICQQITVCSSSSSTKWFSIFFDQDGTTADTTTCLFYNCSIRAYETMLLNFGFSDMTGIYLPCGTGTMKVQIETANSITFTMFGIETSSG